MKKSVLLFNSPHLLFTSFLLKISLTLLSLHLSYIVQFSVYHVLAAAAHSLAHVRTTHIVLYPLTRQLSYRLTLVSDMEIETMINMILHARTQRKDKLSLVCETGA